MHKTASLRALAAVFVISSGANKSQRIEPRVKERLRSLGMQHHTEAWILGGGLGEGRGVPTICRSAEALSQAGGTQTKTQPNGSLSPHCQETGLGLGGGRGGGGGAGAGEKREGDQNPAGVLRQHVMCQRGSVPLQRRNTVNFQQGYGDVKLSFTLLSTPVNSLNPASNTLQIFYTYLHELPARKKWCNRQPGRRKDSECFSG